jgi:D-alanyl-lipoteichoic acid acyltransferase DltB (MBOAT superfamily)
MFPVNIPDLLKYSEQDPMIFTRASFWVFFMAALSIYSFIYKRNTWRNAFLFFASIYFYYKCGGHYFILLLWSVLFNYCVGRGIFHIKGKTGRKVLLASGVGANLLLLAYFKYAYLFAGWINDIFGTTFGVRNLFAEWSNRVAGTHFSMSDIILPVGISFYTFQAISYIVDVYRQKAQVVRNIPDFGFYLSFFPQLVAGPIVRAAEFIPQMYREYSLRKEEMGHALFLISCGLLKKMAISDYISVNFVDRVFDSPLAYSGFENLMAVYGYALQIYCDFSGYTDIAIGLALLMGFHLPANFNSPYKARNITDFWRRWHISLSTWLRDYLYIPLGGNRNGKVRANINILITMLLGGLWHGAGLRFILWGGLHGIALILHKIWLYMFPRRTFEQKNLRMFPGMALTFHFVLFGWIFFRATDMQTALAMIQRIFTITSLDMIGKMIVGYRLVFGVIFIGFTAHWLPAQWKEYVRGAYICLHPAWKIIIAACLFFLLYQVKSSDLQPFIYFQF